jgi:CHRD domain
MGLASPSRRGTTPEPAARVELLPRCARAAPAPVRSQSMRAIFTAVLAAAALLPAGTATAATKLRATLSGAAEVPQAGNGGGSATITLKARKRKVCFNITLRGLGAVTSGHIHKGRKGVAGPVTVPLFAAPTTHPSGCVRASRATIRKLAGHPRRYYVNVHDTRHPAGAARGQLHR